MKPARNAASSSYSDPAKLPKRVLVWALVPVAALLVAVGLLVGIAIGLLVG